MDWFPFWLSLKVALLATGLGFLLALLAAWALSYLRFRGREVLDALITLPLVLPPTVLGYYLLVLVGRNTLPGQAYEAVFGSPLVFTWHAAVVAALVHTVPLLTKFIRASLESVDPVFIKSARSLGIAEWRIFLLIVLPMARRSLLAALVLAFARSLGDFGVTIMIAGNIPGQTQTLSVAIYQAVESGDAALARGMVLLLSLFGFLVVWLANRFNPPHPSVA
ncbi:MAG: molybdate ABC transporter permease subunit [Bryobacter sp.]|nr:molybdate ABC transporter permease subunit [Bryobacter sp.]